MEPLKVFISSVMRRSLEDLVPERTAVQEAILSFPGLARPWAFEAEPASTKPLDASYLDEVKGCDLFVLILGRVLTPATMEECTTALDFDRPILAFMKEVPERDREATEMQANLARHAKYDTFTNADDLREKAKVALSTEFLRLMNPVPGKFGGKGEAFAQLRRFERERKHVRVRPMVPHRERDLFSIESIQQATVRFNKIGTWQSVVVPAATVENVLDFGDSDPPIVTLAGRLQWISLSKCWRMMEERPPGSDEMRLGIGKPGSQIGPVAEDLYAKIRSAGFKPAWVRSARIGEILSRGGEVFYDDDGRYIHTSGDVLVLKLAQP